MVLKPIKKKNLKKIFDKKAIEILEFQLYKSVIAQPEFKKEGQRLQITKEYFEQWCVQAINAKPVGSGSYPIDIIGETINGIKWGADIKALACKVNKNGTLSNSESGETSLAQKFTSTGANLDSMFKNKDYNKIKEGWLEIVKRKNESVIEDKDLDKLYYFFFLRGDDKFYLCGVELDLENLESVKVDRDKTTSESVYLKNYINERHGSTKIYKAKKRLELRLRPKNWVEDDLCIELYIPKPLESVNLRDVDLKEYKKNLFN